MKILPVLSVLLILAWVGLSNRPVSRGSGPGADGGPPLRATDNAAADPAEAMPDVDFQQHVVALRQRLETDFPETDFQIVIQKPFVVIGDGSLEQVQRIATGTVKWAVDGIKQAYFEQDPHRILNIWLFQNAESYQRHNLALFGSRPTTPFGYYSARHQALVMDISTGGGTLVHEIVHPFMERNFPQCPAWFNEGLASLYEQSARRDGNIVGLTNWRLRGLQLAIADQRLPSFQELCGTTTREFYEGHATNYAQARYLCYYLQEKGRLRDFYRAFRSGAAEDPGGYRTLQKILDEPDMDQFQARWETYVAALRFPE